MDMANKYLQMEINILVAIKMEDLMEEVDMNGLKEVIMMDNLYRVWDKEKVNGSIKMEPSMRVIILIF